MSMMTIPGAFAPTGPEALEARREPDGSFTTFTKPSMASVQASTGVIPRNTPYLRVNEFGILIGKQKKGFLEGFRARLLLVEDEGFQLKWTLRFGNPAQYLSTFDGVTCDRGGLWADALARARRIDPQVEPYVSVDALLILDEDITAGDEILPAGSPVGFNASRTNFSEWAEFHAAAGKAGLLGQEVTVDIAHRAVTHNGNTWGVVTFAPCPTGGAA